MWAHKLGCVGPHAQGLSSRQNTGFSYPLACGIFPDQGSKPSPLHWQMDDYPLHHQESSQIKLLNYNTLIYFIFVHSHMEKTIHQSFFFHQSFNSVAQEVSDSATPWTTAREAFPSITNSQSLLKLISIESVMPSKHIILCCPLLFLPSIFSSIGSFPMSQFFESGGQSVGASASALVLPMNIKDWFPLELTGLSPCCPGDSQEPFPTPQFKAPILQSSAFFMVQLSHPYITTLEKP